MHTKRRITLLIDEETLKEGQELGLNLSKTCENCLKNIIKALKDSYSQINAIKGVNTQITEMGARLIIWRTNGA
jgi:post-segregation antitoxin (ccd killing protein)